MDDEITVDVIEDHLLALAERDVIHLYIEMEREYFHFTQWDDDQPVAVSKAARTFIPAPSACEACADSDERFSDSLSHFRLYSQKEGGSREGEAERVPESGASSQGDEGQSDERRSDERPGREAPALPPGAPQAPSSGRQCVTDGLCREGQPCSPEPVAWCKKHAGGTEYPCGPCGTARLRARRHEKLHGN
ncbi:MAG: hypothetical protein LBH13_06525 [Cellulomonadaceae bacterium]|nr:hypothetical protein [Cellulomonadaceae bacterium]